jgi:hypothetical protein
MGDDSTGNCSFGESYLVSGESWDESEQKASNGSHSNSESKGDKFDCVLKSKGKRSSTFGIFELTPVFEVRQSKGKELRLRATPTAAGWVLRTP